MGSAQMVDVTVMVDDGHKDDMPAVAGRLKAEGFVLDELLEGIGVMTGKVPATAVAALTGVTGVSAVEKNRTDYRTQSH
ncbi:ketohydroxyglutarate aldolase [bacterium]|nr:ketohydroxyglutarate aldolase [bacterium]